MPLSDIVTVNISAQTAAPTRPGFGKPLIAAYVSTSIIPGRTAEYGSLTEMTDAGFSTSDPAYLCATKVFSQSPRVPSLKVGRRAHSFTSLVQITIPSGGKASTDAYHFTVGSTAFSVTGTGSASGDATAIYTAVGTNVSNCTATNPSSGVVLLTMATGKLVQVIPDPYFVMAETTTDAGGSSGLADDLAAIVAVDNDWYGLLLDSNSPAEIAAAAAWVEANGKLFVANSIDSAIFDGASTTDIAYTLKQSAYARTALLMSKTQLLSYSGAAWMGKLFGAYDPGAENWAFKTLAGVPADVLTTGQIHAIENKNASVYVALSGLNVTMFGKSASGEFIDITRFIDWLSSELQVSIFGALANNPKIPFTDTGIDTIRSVIMGVLQEGVDVGGLANNPKPVVVCPTAASVSALNKASRNLPNVTFTATLAGAINTLTINGTLSV